MAKKKFYAVAVGREPGIYTTWEDEKTSTGGGEGNDTENSPKSSGAKTQVIGFKGAIYKGFPTKEEAEKFLKEHQKQPTAHPSHKRTLETATTTLDTKRTKPSNKTFEKIISKLIYNVHFDGGSRGNPSTIAGAGVEVIQSKQFDCKHNKEIQRTKIQLRKFLGNTTRSTYTKFTNNQAEYHGAILGLKLVLQCIQGEKDAMMQDLSTWNQNHKNCIEKQLELHVSLQIQGDSEIIIGFLSGEMICRSPNLVVLDEQGKAVLSQIRQSVSSSSAMSSSSSLVDLYSSSTSVCRITMNHVYRKDNSIADALANEAMDSQKSWKTIMDNGGNETIEYLP